MNPCLLIPIYNHGATIGAVVKELAAFDRTCLIVDDGSDAATARELCRLAETHAFVRVKTRAQNGGRGAALKTGYRWAAELGFSHALQLDADGQHAAADVPAFLDAARENPDALILGAPQFDDSAPKARLYGRRLSQFWVWVETLSLDIADPLCGFRCFPLASTLAVLDRVETGDRMDFDPEIAVRLAWDGVPVVNLQTRVRYYEEGVSHFAPLRDNALITWMHTRLVFGMLARLPATLVRRVRGRAS
ncbi:MAG: glycosyltransferase family 2 protein [Proteobacteria bacterium]|nr:glycosyltransferase family 2 protein [Pseudomonadota bacterium]